MNTRIRKPNLTLVGKKTEDKSASKYSTQEDFNAARQTARKAAEGLKWYSLIDGDIGDWSRDDDLLSDFLEWLQTEEVYLSRLSNTGALELLDQSSATGMFGEIEKLTAKFFAIRYYYATRVKGLTVKKRKRRLSEK